mgnify:CR=1 FL=1
MIEAELDSLNLKVGDWIELRYEGCNPVYGELEGFSVEYFNRIPVIEIKIGGCTHIDDPRDESPFSVKKLKAFRVTYA